MTKDPYSSNPTPDSLKLIVTYNGVQLDIPIGGFTGKDARLFREKTGTRLAAIFAGRMELDLDHIAACVWLHLRGDNPGLTYEEVEAHYDGDAHKATMADRMARVIDALVEEGKARATGAPKPSNASETGGNDASTSSLTTSAGQSTDDETSQD